VCRVSAIVGFSHSAALAVEYGRRLLRRIYRLAEPYSNALLLFKADDWHHTLFFPALVSYCSNLHEEELSA
jgi:hypothetical protein